MTNWTSSLSIGTLIAATLLTPAATGAQDGGLAAARDLYASAAYDDALVVLNRLRTVEQPVEQSRAVEQYRALCFLALGRASDAERAIEAVVGAEPSYQPSDTDMSPRVRVAFTTVRSRMLPAIIQQRYTLAKAAFDRKEFAAAAEEFHALNGMLNDPDIASEAKLPPLVDLRTLAGGFEELSAKAAEPPPPPPAPVAPPAAAPPAPPLLRIYTGEDSHLVAPFVINQSLPPFPGQVTIPRTGKIEVVIDETGAVESAVFTAPVSRAYDALALAAARSWRYKPATLDGVPVKYRKVVAITIKGSLIR